MPLHDWSRIPAGLFHDFHQTWSIQIKLALNAGILPKGLSALVEQRSGSRESDVLAIESLGRPRSEFVTDGGVATLVPPVTRFVGPKLEANLRHPRESHRGQAPTGAHGRRDRNRLAGKQGQPSGAARLRREGHRLLACGDSCPRDRLVPANAARPVWHTQGHLGRDRGNRVCLSRWEGSNSGIVRNR